MLATAYKSRMSLLVFSMQRMTQLLLSHFCPFVCLSICPSHIEHTEVIQDTSMLFSPCGTAITQVYCGQKLSLWFWVQRFTKNGGVKMGCPPVESRNFAIT